MADKTFDVYDDKGNKIIDAQPSPIELDGLTPSKTYAGYTASYAGETIKTPLGDIVTKAPAVVAVTGITLSQATMTLAQGASKAITATVAPENATNKTVTFTSADDTIATVDETGLITAATDKFGTVDITATVGGQSAKVTVTVPEPTPKVDGIETTDTTATITLE